MLSGLSTGRRALQSRPMTILTIALLLLVLAAVRAWTPNRRSFLKQAVGGTALVVSSGSPAVPASAATTEQDVYFGVGCFWHIQHEFAVAERDLLGRTGDTFTCKTGYAGGKDGADSEGRVCYHNFQGIADYGKLGHSEVVGLSLPTDDSIVEFAEVYFSLFDPDTKDRVDPMDRGGEYRSLMGLPGGTAHPAYSRIETAATTAGFSLVPGKGSDPDTLRKQIVYVYDTAKYPFYQAEIYHQFHDDFQSKPYGAAYNKLADRALEDGRLKVVGCPDRV